MRPALLHHPHKKSVEEHWVGKSADPIEEQRQRQVGVRKAEPQKQHVKYQPPANAEQHNAPRREHIGQHPRKPARERRRSAINSKNQRGVRGREAQVHQVLRQERLFNAIARHAKKNGDVAAKQGQRHAQNEPIFPRSFARGDSEARTTHDRDSSTAICSLISEGRPSAARLKAEMLCSKGKLADISGFRSTLPEAIKATACGSTLAKRKMGSLRGSNVHTPVSDLP